MVAGGQPVVGRPSRAVELTRLLEGALFGEMALMTEQPRTASIQVVGEADLLEVSRAAVAELTAAVPVLAERLDHFVRERLLKNLLATSPLFKPFDNQQQMELVRRFEGIDVAPGRPSSGRTRWPGTVPHPAGRGRGAPPWGADRPAARRRPLRRDGAARRQPDHGRVRTVVPTSVLFLGRDYFRRLVSALPALRKYFEDLSRSRSAGKLETPVRAALRRGDRRHRLDR